MPASPVRAAASLRTRLVDPRQPTEAPVSLRSPDGSARIRTRSGAGDIRGNLRRRSRVAALRHIQTDREDRLLRAAGAPHACRRARSSSTRSRWSRPQLRHRRRRILNHAGFTWTVSTTGYEATNFECSPGTRKRSAARRLKMIDAAIRLPRRGSSAPRMRPRLYGAALAGRELAGATAAVSRAAHVGLSGGEHREPAHQRRRHRRVGHVPRARPDIAAGWGDRGAACRIAGAGCRVARNGRRCRGAFLLWRGGGRGVIANHRADELRYEAFGIKMRQIDATAADLR